LASASVPSEGPVEVAIEPREGELMVETRDERGGRIETAKVRVRANDQSWQEFKVEHGAGRQTLAAGYYLLRAESAHPAAGSKTQLVKVVAGQTARFSVTLLGGYASDPNPPQASGESESNNAP
jgi:hypothetical protein